MTIIVGLPIIHDVHFRLLADLLLRQPLQAVRPPKLRKRLDTVGSI